MRTAGVSVWHAALPNSVNGTSRALAIDPFADPRASAPLVFAPVLVLDQGGVATLPVPLPANLVQGSLFLQAAVLDAAAANGAFTLTNGLELRIR